MQYIMRLLLKLSLYLGITSLVTLACCAFVKAMNLCIAGFHLYSTTLIWFLPVFGAITGWTYKHWASNSLNTPQVLSRIKIPNPQSKLTEGFFAFLFGSFSQLFGAATGREGAALQIAGSLGDSYFSFIQKKWPHFLIRREDLIRIALGVGFAVVFQTPWAALAFSIEVKPSPKPLRLAPFLLICLFSAIHLSDLVLDHEPLIENEILWRNGFSNWLAIVLLALLLTLWGQAFHRLHHFLNRKGVKKFPIIFPALGGGLVLIFTFLFGFLTYNGLGANLIEASLKGTAESKDFLIRTLFVICSSGFGLKGGDVTPIMSIGASIGAMYSQLILPSLQQLNWGLEFTGVAGLQTGLWAGLSMVGFFCGFARLPLTGAILAAELFGSSTILPAFALCWLVSHMMKGRSLFED